jgi:hypothetical protein
LLGNFLFLGVHWLQSAQVKHQVPSFVRLHIIGKRWHRGAIQARHKDAVQITVSLSAFKPCLVMKVEWFDRAVLVVG